MGTSGVIDDETGTGGADPAESSGPSDRIEGGVPGERLVLFTDAVTAISITLLILPLVDLVPEVASAHEGSSEVITGHLSQIWSFLLSFAVIASIWREHHRAFSSVTMLTRSLTAWNMGWLLSVVVLPLPTEMIGAFGGHDRFVGMFYYSTLLASMVCRLAMLRILKTTPGLVEGDSAGGRRRIEDLYTESYLNVLAVAIALVIALAVPVLQYYSLLLLAVLPRLERLRRRRAAR
ncbi:TMEM175 family protein [Streptomyces iconiensis]|uniref:TMEM175 family protein n=1 Tax=Streptomyces iconiensis TaxID=1384038 RepID=A0ABT7A015_9ACTN|nr:TMEM175 family protein [Streptomyces iconiensis]MDJ1134665.1 TMEM175 family protein [Streptomyces iconiensis]